MAFNERNSEGAKKTDQKDPSPSTSNGAQSVENCDEKAKVNPKNKAKIEEEFYNKIRVGRDYQVIIPAKTETISTSNLEDIPERGLLVWAPTTVITDMVLDEFISTAKTDYGYSGEQALGMLFWHKYDLKKSITDLSNFQPFPDEWTVEDKALFEQAFQMYGKSFIRIHHMLPDKSIGSLVKYYYTWKKVRKSANEKQEKRLARNREIAAEFDNETSKKDDSETDNKSKRARKNS